MKSPKRMGVRPDVATILLSAAAAVAGGAATVLPAAGYAAAVLGLAAAVTAWRDVRARLPRRLTPSAQARLAADLTPFSVVAPIHVWSYPDAFEPAAFRDTIAAAFRQAGVSVVIGQGIVAIRDGLAIFYHEDLEVHAKQLGHILAKHGCHVDAYREMSAHTWNPDFMGPEYRFMVVVGARPSL